MKRTWTGRLGLFALAIALCVSACRGREDAPIRREFFALDTVISLRAYGADAAAMDACQALVQRYEGLFSRTREGSDVWRINHAEGEAVLVDAETAELLRTAVRYGELSGGLFDVSIAPVTALWDFHAEEPALPDAAALEEARGRVDYRAIEIDGNAVRVPARMQIDLGGIAKGYIADRLADALREEGVKSALLNLGGNVYALGSNANGTPWRIGVQGPFQRRDDVVATLEVEDRSVVTSAIYERYFVLDGVFYHHILDPRSGYPVAGDLEAVCIVAERSVDADALATAAFLLGSEEGMALVERQTGIEAVFVLQGGEIRASSGIGGRGIPIAYAE